MSLSAKKQDKKGNTPLHLAADAQTVLELVQNGADIFARNDAGQTPLDVHEAEYMKRKKRKTSVQQDKDEPYEPLRAITAFREAMQNQPVDAGTWFQYWKSRQAGEKIPMNSKRWAVQQAVIPLFLQAVEQSGGKLGPVEDYPSELRLAITRSAENMTLWLEHCDRQGEPPSGKDLFTLGAHQKLEFMFALPYWKNQPPVEMVGRLQEFIEQMASVSFRQIMQDQFPDMPGALVAQWLSGEEGQKLNAQEVKELVRELPEPVREQVHNLHQQVAARSRNERQQAYAQSGILR